MSHFGDEKLSLPPKPPPPPFCSCQLTWSPFSIITLPLHILIWLVVLFNLVSKKNHVTLNVYRNDSLFYLVIHLVSFRFVISVRFVLLWYVSFRSLRFDFSSHFTTTRKHVSLCKCKNIKQTSLHRNCLFCSGNHVPSGCLYFIYPT